MGFLQDQITATEALITATQAAVLALTIGGAQQYTLDTGQTRQVVTKLNLSSLNKSLDMLYNRRATLKARLNGSGSITVVPSY